MTNRKVNKGGTPEIMALCKIAQVKRDQAIMKANRRLARKLIFRIFGMWVDVTMINTYTFYYDFISIMVIAMDGRPTEYVLQLNGCEPIDVVLPIGQRKLDTLRATLMDQYEDKYGKPDEVDWLDTTDQEMDEIFGVSVIPDVFKKTRRS